MMWNAQNWYTQDTKACTLPPEETPPTSPECLQNGPNIESVVWCRAWLAC